jgi:hypothetical protein
MRADHFAARLVPVWGCGKHTKMLIMLSVRVSDRCRARRICEISGGWPP